MKSVYLRNRTVCSILALCMISTVALSGCDSADNKSSSETAQSSSTQSSESSPKKLLVGLQSSNLVTDYDDNLLTKKLEEELGADLEFYFLPADTTEFSTKVSLLVSAGTEVPDVIICENALTAEAILDYGTKGAFIKLNDYVNDKEMAPNFSVIPDEDKKIMLNGITSADGNIYSMPKFEPETWNLTPYRMYVNGAWLKKLSLNVPTTTDELYNVLTAFRDKDPNENGIQDEIGVYGISSGGYGENIINALMNSFVFYNAGLQNGGLSLDDEGKNVIAPFVTDAWQDGLEYLNKLYKEKLLAASIFTDDDTQFKATLNNETNIVGIVSSGSTSKWTDADNNPNFQEMDIIPPLAGPEGIAYTPYSVFSAGQAFFITSACKNPELAFKLGDLFLNPEISLVARYGEEDVDWTRDSTKLATTTNAYIEAGLYDELYIATMSTIWGEPSNHYWRNINPRYAPLEWSGKCGNLLTPYDPSIKSSQLNAYSYEHYYPAHPENILPVLRYTNDEAGKNSEPITNITEYIKQSVAEFVTGARNVDSDWDSYIKEINSMGLSTWLDTAQTAYDRIK